MNKTIKKIFLVIKMSRVRDLNVRELSRVQHLKKYLFDEVEDTKKYAKSKCNNYVN